MYTTVYINKNEQAIVTRFTWVNLINKMLSRKRRYKKKYTQYDFLHIKISN